MSFVVDLRNQVPQYDLDLNHPEWGGPACCQMAMNGYPAGGNCNIDQTTIWNYIQANDQEPKAWYSDPYAVTKTLNDKCPPPNNGEWVDTSGTDQEKVLYTLLFWMAKFQFPSLVCLFGHDYWNVITYYETTDDPRVVFDPMLQKIGFYSPGNPTQYQEVDGAVWLQSPAYFGLRCGANGPCGQKWNNMWVGIGEPPKTQGKVAAESISRVGQKLISPQEAASVAQDVIAERRREKSEFLLRQLSGVRPGRPMLVRELPIGRSRGGQDVRYFVVPFQEKHEVDETGRTLARFSVLINGYTGRFEELSLFPRPIRYRSEREAVSIVGRNLGLSRSEERKLKAELVFRPLRPYVSSATPAWSVSTADRTICVTQSGIILGSLAGAGAFRGA